MRHQQSHKVVLFMDVQMDSFLLHCLETGQPLWQLPIARPYGATELDRIVDADMKPIIRNGVIYTLAYNGNLSSH